MLRVHVSFVQFVQALSIAGIGLAIAFVPLALVWALDRAFEADILVMWRVAADAWLLGHGVTVQIQLPEIAALEFGSELATQPFDVTFLPLGFTLLTFVLSLRSGLRLHEAAQGMAAEVRERLTAYDGVGEPERIIGKVIGWGVVVATLTTSAIGILVAWTAQHELASPSLLQAAIFPGLIAGVAHLVAVLWRERDRLLELVGEWLTIGERWLQIIRVAVTSAAITTVAVLGLGAGAVALTIFTHFDTVVALSQASSPTILGVIVMFLAQLAALPNAIVWGAAWMLGSPVQIGEGSSLSVFGTSLGPLPNVPIFGAVPASNEPWFLALLVVTAVTVVVLGMLVARSRLLGDASWWAPVAAAAISGVLAATAVTALAALSGGAIGPGRMQVTGPDLAYTVLFAGLGLTVLTVLGFLGSRAVDFVAGYDAEESGRSSRETDGNWIGADDDGAETTAEDVSASPRKRLLETMRGWRGDDVVSRNEVDASDDAPSDVPDGQDTDVIEPGFRSSGSKSWKDED
ncbi:DUF6350 family protein [uncultured Agrococcus sp.]|uniref:cell division protein PerM n=1 Tax=uncultured Agrococcus sp. TaxID=382258 RepID=UPI0025D2F947|nr:DUF6350 family protein [uncultured Agrococcus sp.]